MLDAVQSVHPPRERRVPAGVGQAMAGNGRGGGRRYWRPALHEPGAPGAQGDAARGPDRPAAEQHSYAPLHLGWKTPGHARRFDTEIVNSVDDFVICGLAPEAAMRAVIERMMLRLRLPLKARKTQ